MRKYSFSFLIITTFLLFSSELFAQVFPLIPDGPGANYDSVPKNRLKRRYPMERGQDEPFLMVFLKNFRDGDYVYFDCAFNSEIKKESVFEGNITINDKIIEKESILFSRDGHRCKFRVYRMEGQTIKMKMSGIRSWDGLMMPPLEINEILENSMYHFDKETGQWQKFSL